MTNVATPFNMNLSPSTANHTGRLGSMQQQYQQKLLPRKRVTILVSEQDRVQDDPQTSSPTLQKAMKRVPLQRRRIPLSQRKSAPASLRIPIPTTATMTNDAGLQEEQEWDELRLADHRDFLMYSRVVHGIRQTQRRNSNHGRSSSSKAASSLLLYHENEQCLSHVIRMRQLDDPEEEEHDHDVADLMDETDDEGYDDDCIFHLEL